MVPGNAPVQWPDTMSMNIKNILSAFQPFIINADEMYDTMDLPTKRITFFLAVLLNVVLRFHVHTADGKYLLGCKMLYFRMYIDKSGMIKVLWA